MKYINHKVTGFLVFEESLGSHQDVARRLNFKEEDIISAGRVGVNGDVLQMTIGARKAFDLAMRCYGRATTIHKVAVNRDSYNLSLALLCSA